MRKDGEVAIVCATGRYLLKLLGDNKAVSKNYPGGCANDVSMHTLLGNLCSLT